MTFADERDSVALRTATCVPSRYTRTVTLPVTVADGVPVTVTVVTAFAFVVTVRGAVSDVDVARLTVTVVLADEARTVELPA